MKRFALIGAAGYVAERHMRAIEDTGNVLVAITDPSDSVGVVDKYFPEAAYFQQFERFDRHLDKLRQQGRGVDCLTICSPNHLHDAHCRFGLRSGMSVICEKPLVLNPWNLKALQIIEKESGQRINNILQLRLHPSIKGLKKKIVDGPKDKIYEVELNYIVPRGLWYQNSWKGETSKSGGITTNIGVHFFDMLLWVFGPVQEQKVHLLNSDRAAGSLSLKNAKVQWKLSIRQEDLPDIKKGGVPFSYRSLKVDGEQVDFSTGFEDLHTLSYEGIINGEGYGTDEVRDVIQLLHDIRNGEEGD